MSDQETRAEEGSATPYDLGWREGRRVALAETRVIEEKARAEVARLRAALEVFADPMNWLQYDTGYTKWDGDAEEPWTIAQEALKGGG
jgi:hypothetical protein